MAADPASSPQPFPWPTLTAELADLVAAVSETDDELAAIRDGTHRVADLIGAQVCAVVRRDRVLAAVAPERTPREELVRVVTGASHVIAPGSPPLPARAVALEEELWLVVARSAGAPDDREARLLADVGRNVAMALRLSRQARENARLVADLQERGRLLERLVRISRSISSRAPLQEVFDAITAGAAELLGAPVVGLRLIDPDDETMLVTTSVQGVTEDVLHPLARSPLGEGAGGRAVTEQRLVVIEDYTRAPEALPAFAGAGLQAAMAAPVHEQGQVVGSLTVASWQRGRAWTPYEQEALLAFAEHASLALTDARTVEAMREAQHAKDLFLAMVSHELKTPLTVVMGTLRTLEAHGAELTEERRTAMLASAFQRGRDLERLIDRLLQGARAELATQRRAARLATLVAEAVDGFETSRPLVRGPIPDVDLLVDVTAVRGVIGILLENAVAHAPDASEVGVDVAVADAEVRIAVRNRGALPADLDTHALFVPFQRGGNARSSGVGLGLSIAWRLATSVGGRIDPTVVDDEVIFTFRFPLEPVAQPAG